MRNRDREASAGGFTLIELLTVIAVIAIRASLLLPVLAAAKSKGCSISCLNNERQLMLACLLYVNDFDEALPYNLGAAEIKQLEAKAHYWNWTTPVMNWELDPDNINDGYFLNKPDSMEWIDLPASYQSGAANLAVADGHLELHKWRCESTKPPSQPDAAHLPFPVPAGEQAGLRLG